MHDEAGLEVGVLELGQTGIAVVQTCAVGRPAGERLKMVGRTDDVPYRVAVCIVEQQVGFTVIDFYLLMIMVVEHLGCLVGAVGNEW